MKDTSENANQEAIDNFWKQLTAVGKQVLEMGLNSGFGMSLVEIKFRNGIPMVMVNTFSTSVRFATNEETKQGLTSLLDESEQVQYDGSRTVTLIYQKGKVSRMLVDNSSNKILT